MQVLHCPIVSLLAPPQPSPPCCYMRILLILTMEKGNASDSSELSRT